MTDHAAELSRKEIGQRRIEQNNFGASLKMQRLKGFGATDGLCQIPAQRFQAAPQLLTETAIVADD